MNEFEYVLKRIREMMENYADYMATGSLGADCLTSGQPIAERYMLLTGRIEALALLEREILDLKENSEMQDV